MSDSELKVAYAGSAIPAAVGMPLAGMFSRHPRCAEQVRDPLSVQALDVRAAETRMTIATADLLVITGALHRAVAERAGMSPAELLLSATHTHSSVGGYWNVGRRGEYVMGPYRAAVFDQVVAAVASAVRAARAARGVPGTVSAAGATVDGASRNRRQHGGPVDPELQLLRFLPAAGIPIDLVSFGVHPVVVIEHEPLTLSADFPGVLRRRLERRGVRPIFFQGAVGGLNPLAATTAGTSADHLDAMVDRLESAYDRAAHALRPVRVNRLLVSHVDVPMPPARCRVLPPPMRLSSIGEALLFPLRDWFWRMGRGALAGEPPAPLQLVRLGEVALLGTPCDLGMNVGLALKRVLAAAGVRVPIVGSHCNGYLGYVHLRADYDHIPAGRDRALTLYENAMSLSGWTLGDAFVERVAAAVMPQ